MDLCGQVPPPFVEARELGLVPGDRLDELVGALAQVEPLLGGRAGGFFFEPQVFQRVEDASSLREDLFQIPQIRQRDRRTNNFPGEEVLEVRLQRRVGPAFPGHALDHHAIRGLGVVLHDFCFCEELLAQLDEGLALLDDVV